MTYRTYPARLPVQTLEDIANLPDNLSVDGLHAGLDNTARATFAARAVEAYACRVGGDEVNVAVSDMLSDLMHFCDAVGLEFEDALRQADRHYGAEVRGERYES